MTFFPENTLSGASHSQKKKQNEMQSIHECGYGTFRARYWPAVAFEGYLRGGRYVLCISLHYAEHSAG
jgi:hypothetical protein